MKDAAREPESDVQALRRENAAMLEALRALEQQVAERDAALGRARDALSEAQAQLDAVFGHSRDALFVLEATAGGRFAILRANAVCIQALGLGVAADGVRWAFVDEIEPKPLADFVRATARCCVVRRAACEDQRTITLARGRVVLHLVLVPQCDATGRVTRLIGIVRDITADMRTVAFAAVQRQLEGQFRSLAESSTDIICRYDRSCRLVFANSGLMKLIRRPLEGLLGCTPNEHYPDLRLAHYQASLEAVIDSGVERDIELRLPDTGDGIRYHHIRIFPERGLHGETVGALALGRDVTERKHAEDRLYASEQAFRTVVEHSLDNIARYDLNLRRTYANPALLSVMQRGAGEVIGKTPAEVSPFVDPDGYMDLLRHVVATRREATDAVQLRDASGRVRWGHILVVPELSPSGAVVSILAISRDIDELKRSEQLFRTLTENFPDLIARFDAHHRYLYANPAVTQAFGVAQETLIGKPIGEMQLSGGAALIACIQAGIDRAFAEGAPNEAEACWPDHAGGRVFELRHIPEHDSEGRVVSVLGVARDITRLRSTEQALRDSERAFRTLAENAPDPIIRYDRQCRRLYVNPEFQRVCGLGGEQLLGRKAGEDIACPKQIERRFRNKLRQVMRSGVAAKFELSWDLSGKAQWWYVHAVPEYDAHGSVQSGLTIWRDISEAKEAELRLRESYDMLRELASRRETAREEERKRIARELHDELGQQLTALRMRVSTLRMQFGPHHPELARQIQDLLALTDDTMQVMRGVVSSLRPAALDAGIAAALEWLVAEFSRGARVACSLSIPDEGFSLSEDRAVALFRIVQEALTNVARHADARHVRVTLARVGDECLLEVRDDGCGFDPVAIRRRSFGLAGMRERMLMLGGKIDIASSPGKGTTIGVRMPWETDGEMRACSAGQLA